jgi:hypothetical protein
MLPNHPNPKIRITPHLKPSPARPPPSPQPTTLRSCPLCQKLIPIPQLVLITPFRNNTTNYALKQKIIRDLNSWRESTPRKTTRIERGLSIWGTLKIGSEIPQVLNIRNMISIEKNNNQQQITSMIKYQGKHIQPPFAKLRIKI